MFEALSPSTPSGYAGPDEPSGPLSVPGGTRSATLAGELTAVGGPRPHLLTIALEDYYQTFPGLIHSSHWYRFETRIEQCTLRTLDLLDECGVRATFFTLGWTAARLPDLIREVARRGHEVATKGHSQHSVRNMPTPAAFRDDMIRGREAIEDAIGAHVIGYRAPGWLEPDQLWALEILAQEGFAYDSSVKPLLGSYAREPWRRFAHVNQFGHRTLWEFPISSIGLPGMLVPIGAGNYFRQLPAALMNRAVAYWDRTYTSPFMMYFHTWELDPDQPQITGAPLLKRIRVYRNLGRVPDTLRHYFGSYAFTGIAHHLGLEDAAPRAGFTTALDRPTVIIHPVEGANGSRPHAANGTAAASTAAPRRAATDAPPIGVTLVVPCYNEEPTLPYLAKTLHSVTESLADEYALSIVLVDDCSVDGTATALERLFGSWPNCTVVRHPTNQGAARAILTGIQHARTDVVASIDCDCSYDPHELRSMVPLLAEGVDLVTGSPYHKGGVVLNVPQWRLALSRAASALYRAVTRQKLHTYTSCFRVYRRSAALDVELTHGGFLGVAEMIGRMDLRGSQIVEYPTTLNVRVFGHSKMRVLRTALGHLGLLSELTLLRVRGRGGRVERPSPAAGTLGAP